MNKHARFAEHDFRIAQAEYDVISGVGGANRALPEIETPGGNISEFYRSTEKSVVERGSNFAMAIGIPNINTGIIILRHLVVR